MGAKKRLQTKKPFKSAPPKKGSKLAKLSPPKESTPLVFDPNEFRPPPETADEEAAYRKWADGLGEWYKETKAEIAGMHRYQLEKELVDDGVCGASTADGAEVGWLRVRLAYHRQEIRRERLGGETSLKVQKTIDALDASNVLPDWMTDVYTVGGVTETADDPRVERKNKEEIHMAKKTKAEAKTAAAAAPKVPTISSFMRDLLRRPSVGTNQAILAEVQANFKDSKFSAGHVSWYKNAFMTGRLPGQTKGEAYNQPMVREKKDETAKPAATKTVAKTTKATKSTPKPKGKPKAAPKKAAKA